MQGYRLSQATVGSLMRDLADAITIAEYYKGKETNGKDSQDPKERSS